MKFLAISWARYYEFTHAHQPDIEQQQIVVAFVVIHTFYK